MNFRLGNGSDRGVENRDIPRNPSSATLSDLCDILLHYTGILTCVCISLMRTVSAIIYNKQELNSNIASML